MKTQKTIRNLVLATLLFVALTQTSAVVAGPFDEEALTSTPIIPMPAVSEPEQAAPAPASVVPVTPKAKTVVRATPVPAVKAQVSKAPTVARTTARSARQEAATPAPAPQNAGVSLNGFSVPQGLDGNNYCGQYAMTSVLNSLGCNVTFSEVYRETNPLGIFSAPTTIVDYLNRKGCTSSLRMGASLEDLTRKLDSGKPVIVLVNCNGTPHWVAISGYKKDAQGNIVSWELRDSVWGVSGTGGKHEMPNDEFSRIWSTPLQGVTMGSLANYRNLMVDIDSYDPARASTTPIYSGTFGTAFEDNVAGGINDVVGGWGNGRPTSVVSGVGKLGTAIPAAVLTVPGRALTNGGHSMMDDASDRWNRGGVINRTVGAAEWTVGGAGRVTGNVLDFGGNLISSTGTVVGNGLKKTGEAASNLYNRLKFW